MHNELPIACNLDAPSFAARAAEIAALGRDALVAAEQDGPRALLRFAAGPGIRERVERFVAGEAACCAFLTMAVAEHDDEVILRVDAPTGAEAVVGELVAAFEA
jgi:hypothetical protein